MKHTTYLLPPGRHGESFRAAVAADLHGRNGHDALRILERMKPDFILVPGDVSNHFCTPPELLSFGEWNAYRNGMRFLSAAAKIAPVFYALGNHEMGGIHSGRPWAQKHFPPYKPLDSSIREEIESFGVTLLDDRYVMHNGIAIGGLTSGLTYPDQQPNLEFLDRFAALDAYKLLICHHPEYYPQYIRKTGINLTVSGHAHGGQWSFFGQAIFAPGQGLFPRLVRGVHDKRLVISRGMTNSAYVPRIGVPCEVVEIRVGCPYDKI
jgi:predicted MPP superfamily phosphohydrolase